MSFGTQWRFEESFDVKNFLKYSKDGAAEVRRELFGTEVKDSMDASQKEELGKFVGKAM